MLSTRGLISTALLLAVLPGCGNDPVTPCFCTEEFRIYTLRVVDGEGAPVSDLTLTRTLVRTGQLLDPGWLGMLEPGVYLIADDSMRDVFSGDGDVLRVRGEKDGASFEVDFRFAVPEPCRCHVEKVAGPETVVLN